MPVEFRGNTSVIPAGQVGVATIPETVVFNSPVLEAQVVINGFQVRYDTGARLFANLEINTGNITISGTNVDYEIRVEVADFTGGESFNGFVTAVVFVRT